MHRSSNEFWQFMEFDADQLSRSPNNSAPMCGAVRDYQQCKLCRKLERADCLQRGPSLGLVTNETGERAPVELNTCRVQIASPKLLDVHLVARVTIRNSTGRAGSSPRDLVVLVAGVILLTLM